MAKAEQYFKADWIKIWENLVVDAPRDVIHLRDLLVKLDKNDHLCTTDKTRFRQALEFKLDDVLTND